MRNTWSEQGLSGRACERQQLLVLFSALLLSLELISCSPPPPTEEVRSVPEILAIQPMTSRGSVATSTDLIPNDGVRWLGARSVARLASGAEWRRWAKDPQRPDLAFELAEALLTVPPERSEALLSSLLAARLLLALDIRPSVLLLQAGAFRRLGLLHQARKAYRAFLGLEPGSPRSDLVWDQLANLDRLGQHTSLAERWKKVEGATLATDEELLQLAIEFPWLLQDKLMGELLPGWADSTLADNQASANRSLELAVRLTGALQRAGTENQLSLDALACVDHSTGRLAEDDWRLLLEGLSEYGQAERLPELAASRRSSFARAARKLQQVDCPLALRVQLEYAKELFAVDNDRARTQIEKLSKRIDSSRYPRLAAHALWMSGLSEARHQNLFRAAQNYSLAQALLVQVGDGEGVDALAARQFETERKLGRTADQWSQRLGLLRRFAERGLTRELHNLLEDTTHQLLSEGEIALAETFQLEQIPNAHSLGNQVAIVEALTFRAEIQAAKGDLTGSLRSLFRARLQASQLGSENSARPGLELSRRIAETKIQQQLDPHAAVVEVSDALAGSTLTGRGERIPRLLGLRATAHRALANPSDALTDLDTALAILDTRTAAGRRRGGRLSFFESAQGLFNLAIAIAAEDLGDGILALAYAEESRARELTETLQELYGPLPLLTPANLPAEVVFLEVAVLDETILVWSIDSSRVELHEVQHDRYWLADQVRAVRSAIAYGIPSEIHQRGAGLFQELFGEALAGVTAETTLVISPDRELYALPFAALRRKGRFLIEDHALVIAPSGAVHLAANAALERRIRSSEPAALVIGDPRFDTATFDLDRLPGARLEANRVAAIYEPRAQLLIDRQATALAVLAGFEGKDVVHIGAHGVISRGDPETAVIALAPETEWGEERGLSLARIRRLRALPPALVTLAVCRSASPFSKAQREGVAGLAEAFLAAGVPTVVAALWDLEDRGSSEFSWAFHRAYRDGLAAHQALRRAQLEMLRHPEKRFRRPQLWAASQLYGGSNF